MSKSNLGGVDTSVVCNGLIFNMMEKYSVPGPWDRRQVEMFLSQISAVTYDFAVKFCKFADWA